MVRSIAAFQSTVFAAFLCLIGGAHAAEQNSPAPSVHIIGVGPNDSLNLRAQPDAKAKIVGKIAPDTGDIAVIAQGVTTRDWLKLRSGKVEGWANARFLSYDSDQEPRLPVRLHCTGNEPNWSADISYSRADTDLAFDGAKQTLALDPPLAQENRKGTWLLAARPASQSAFLLLAAKACSDGAADTPYPFAVAARLHGKLLAGCCR